MCDFFMEAFSPVDQNVNILVLLIISLSNSSRRVLGTGLTLWQKKKKKGGAVLWSDYLQGNPYAELYRPDGPDLGPV